MESIERLPKAIFRFLDLSEINIALREEVPKLHIIMYSNPSLPYIVSVMHWARLRELEPMYKIKKMSARHQYTIVVRIPRNKGFLNDYLNPNTSSMKVIVVNTVYMHSLRSLMGQEWEVQARPIYREANRCMDALVKRGAHQQHLLSVYTTCSNFVSYPLVRDLVGLGSSRLCTWRSDNVVVV